MTRSLSLLLLLAACGKSTTEGAGGYVIRLHLDPKLEPSSVSGLEARIAKKGGFPDFSTRAGNIDITSVDVDADGLNEVVLTWPAGATFEETSYVRLLFDNTAAMPITITATARDKSAGDLARGTLEATVPAGGVDAVDVTLGCLVAGCAAVVADGGPDLGADGGGPGSDATTLFGQTPTAAGTSTSGTLKLEHHFGHPVGRGSSSAGSTKVESTVTTSR